VTLELKHLSPRLVCILLIIIIVGLSGCGPAKLTEAPTPALTAEETPTAIAAPTASPTPSEEVISWQDAAKYIGEYKTVEGTIVLSYYAEKSKGKPTFLDFHDPYQGYFKAIIWEGDRGKFPSKPEIYYLNKRVWVRGLIESYKGVPEVVLREPWQISILGLNSREIGEQAVFVTRVIDGDTITIEGGVRVRYIGIDAPETVKFFGNEATEKNRELVGGKRVRLEKDIQDKDEYGRLLRYVWLDDTMVNAELVRLGYAYSYSYPPNVKYQTLLLRLERQARERGLGLWSK
jgi:micrococcal nuclease